MTKKGNIAPGVPRKVWQLDPENSETQMYPEPQVIGDQRVLHTLSLSNASLTGFVDRGAGEEGVGGGVSAIVEGLGADVSI